MVEPVSQRVEKLLAPVKPLLSERRVDEAELPGAGHEVRQVSPVRQRVVTARFVVVACVVVDRVMLLKICAPVQVGEKD